MTPAHLLTQVSQIRFVYDYFLYLLTAENQTIYYVSIYQLFVSLFRLHFSETIKIL